MTTRSLAIRTAFALGLQVGYYVFALCIVAGLLGLIWVELAVLHLVQTQLTILAVVGAGAILWSLVPRPERFRPPGLRIIDHCAWPHSLTRSRVLQRSPHPKRST